MVKLELLHGISPTIRWVSLMAGIQSEESLNLERWGKEVSKHDHQSSLSLPYMSVGDVFQIDIRGRLSAHQLWGKLEVWLEFNYFYLNISLGTSNILKIILNPNHITHLPSPLLEIRDISKSNQTKCSYSGGAPRNFLPILYFTWKIAPRGLNRNWVSFFLKKFSSFIRSLKDSLFLLNLLTYFLQW